MVDTDHNGIIDRAELRQLIESLGIDNFSNGEEYVDELFKKVKGNLVQCEVVDAANAEEDTFSVHSPIHSISLNTVSYFILHFIVCHSSSSYCSV